MATYQLIRREVPLWPAGRYRLTERSEIARQPGGMRELLDEGAEIVWDGMPGPHMEPLDAQAQANVQHVIQHLGGFKALDPTANLSMIVGEYDDADNKIAELEAQIATIRSSARSNVASGMPTRIPPPQPIGTAQDAAPPPPPAAAPVVAVPGQGGVRGPELPDYLRGSAPIPAPPPLPAR